MSTMAAHAYPVPRMGQDIVHSLIVLSLFMVTGDIFFVIHVGGMTVRLVQPLILMASLSYIFLKGNHSLIIPQGFIFIFVFFAITFSFFPMYFWTRNISYSVAFFFCIATILLFVNYYGVSEARTKVLLRWYVIACMFVSGFGILQFAAATHGINLLVQQWYVKGVLPRVNGFSYEPSYYVMYNGCGWAMLLYLVVERVNILPRKIMLLAFVMASLAGLLSLSRSGLLLTYIFFMLFVVRSFFRARKGADIPRWFWGAAILGICAPVLALFYLIVERPYVFRIFTAGLGMFGESTHSVGPRLRALFNTIDVAIHHPLIGAGLGGVGPAIADHYFPGMTFGQYMATKTEGLNIFAEAFAEGGILGGLCLLAFLISLYVPCFRHRGEETELHKINIALLLGLSFELILLAIEPSLVRMHLWTHIAILSVVNYRVLAAHKNRAPST